MFRLFSRESTLRLLIFGGVALGVPGAALLAQEWVVEPSAVYSSSEASGYQYELAPNAVPWSQNADEESNVVEDEDAVDDSAKIEELEQRLDKLTADFKAEQEKNKKKEKLTDPYNLKFGGFLGLGAYYVSQDDVSKDLLGNAKNVYDVHDLRFTCRGNGHGMQFAAGVGVQESIKLYDNYVRFKDSPIFGDITIGHFYVESGMESIEPAFEPAFISTDEGASFFRMNRRLGIGSTNYNAEKTARLFLGIFAAPSVNTWPNRTENEDPGYLLNTRLTAAPILVEDDKGFTREVLHFGGSFYWLDPTSDDSSLTLKTRGHGWVGNSPYFINGKISLEDRSYSVSQMEIAYQREGFAATADGYVMSITNGGGNAYGSTAAMRWCLTPGCTRSYNKNDARFTTMNMPEEAIFVNFDKRGRGQGFGALEAVVKWEYLETDDVNFTSVDPTTGTVNRVVTGANWWWNQQTCLAFNWEHAVANVEKGAKSGDAKNDSCFLQMGVKF